MVAPGMNGRFVLEHSSYHHHETQWQQGFHLFIKYCLKCMYETVHPAGMMNGDIPLK
jgi:hypothetical protein